MPQKRKPITAIDLGGYTYRFEHSVYNPLLEILVCNNLKIVFIAKALDKTEEDGEISRKFIIEVYKFVDYNIIWTEDCY